MRARLQRLTVGARPHIRALSEIFIFSFVGILATALLQIVLIRGLGVIDFGVFASYMAIVNIVAIGSSALRSSIAVNTATSRGSFSSSISRFDSSLVESLVSSVFVILVIAALSIFGAQTQFDDPWMFLFLVVTIFPTFLFARGQGLIQGDGRSREVVLWTTGIQVFLLVLATIGVIAGARVYFMVAAVFFTTAIGAVGTSWQAKVLRLRTGARPFGGTTLTVLILATVFAWVTNIDVFLVSESSSSEAAGFYAASATLVKTTFIIPSMLALYLLPRFARVSQGAQGTKAGVFVSLAITGLSSVLFFVVFLLTGEPIVRVLFGESYIDSASLLPWLALMWLPWAMSQALLIRLTAIASKVAATALTLTAVIQIIGASLTLPDLYQFMFFNGILGSVTFFALLLTERVWHR